MSGNYPATLLPISQTTLCTSKFFCKPWLIKKPSSKTFSRTRALWLTADSFRDNLRVFIRSIAAVMTTRLTIRLARTSKATHCIESFCLKAVRLMPTQPVTLKGLLKSRKTRLECPHLLLRCCWLHKYWIWFGKETPFVALFSQTASRAIWKQTHNWWCCSNVEDPCLAVAHSKSTSIKHLTINMLHLKFLSSSIFHLRIQYLDFQFSNDVYKNCCALKAIKFANLLKSY